MQYRYRRLCTHSLPGGDRLDLLQRHFHGFLILRASRWIPYLPHTTPVYPKIRESNSYYVYTALSRDIPRETYSFRTKDSSIPISHPLQYELLPNSKFYYWEYYMDNIILFRCNYSCNIAVKNSRLFGQSRSLKYSHATRAYILEYKHDPRYDHF